MARSLVVGGTSAFLLLAFAVSAHGAAPPSKESRHARMGELQSSIATLKAQSTPAARTALSAAQVELDAISAGLGGDLPCAVGAAGVSGKSGASTKVAPTAPTNCTPTTTPFNNAVPVAIPDGPGVVTSTITVAGADPYLWDVDLTTFITHSFPGDVDMTIQSPAGTIVTLTTDNAGTNDNVFNGTVWDDSANPLGQVPYVNNDGLVTDHLYAIGVLASPLVPEEALAAFVGEDPNGDWTLTISDDAAGDGGSLDSWTLSLTTFAQAPIVSPLQSFEQAVAVAVPAGPAVVTSEIIVAGLTAPVCNAAIRTTLTHSFPGDLDITLTSPAGTVVTLTTDNAGTNDDVFAGTVWTDTANPAGQVPYTTNNGMVSDHAYVISTLASPLVVEESMGAFMGESANGTWTVTISDDAAGDGGSLDAWGLDFVTCTCQSADVALAVTDTPDPVDAGANLTYTLTATNIGPTDAADMVIDTATPADTTFVSLVAPPALTCVTPVVGSTGAISCNTALPTAAAGEYELTLVVAVEADTPDATLVTLNATAATTTNDPDPLNNAATTNTTVSTNADLAASLTSAPDPTVTAGDGVVYTAGVTNDGPSDAIGVTIDLPLPAQMGFTAVNAVGGVCVTPPVGTSGLVSCTWAGATAPGGSHSMIVDAVVDPATPDATLVVATATVSSTTTDPDPANDSADADTLVEAPRADLTVTKDDGVASAVPGGTVTYTIVVSNTGPRDSLASTVIDTPPAALTCTWTAAFAGGATGTAAGAGFINESVDLPNGGSVTYTMPCDVAADAAGSLDNTVDVAVPAGVVDPDPANNTDTDTDALDGEADLSVTQSVAPATAAPGESVTYTIGVANAGPSDVSDALLSDTFPADLACTWTAVYAGGASGAAAGAGNLSEILDLPVGGSATFTVACDVAADAASATPTNTATIDSPATTDPTPANDSADADITISASAAVAATKTVAAAGGFAPGTNVTYTIVLDNTGVSAQGDNPGDEFVDVLPADLTGVSAAATSGTAVLAAGTVTWNGAIPASGSVTITIVATIDDAATGTISNQGTVNFDADGDNTNEASAPSDDPGQPGGADPTDFDVVEEPLPADVSATKTVAAAGGFEPGTDVTYTIVLTNSGTGEQGDNPGNEFVDVLPAGLTGVSAAATAGTAVLDAGTDTVTWNGTLAVDASVTITIVATIDESAAGTISNQGTVNFDGDGDGSNESSAPSDDPGEVGAANATAFGVVGPPPPPPQSSLPNVIPSTNLWALLALGLGFVVLARRSLLR